MIKSYNALDYSVDFDMNLEELTITLHITCLPT